MLFKKPDFHDLSQMMEGIELMTCTKCGSRDWEMRVNYENWCGGKFTFDFIWCFDCHSEVEIADPNGRQF